MAEKGPDNASQNDIYRAVGLLSGQIEGIRSEIVEVKSSLLESEKRSITEARRIREDHIMYGRRIASLEKWKTWVIGAAFGILMILSIVAINAKEFIHKVTGN